MRFFPLGGPAPAPPFVLLVVLQAGRLGVRWKRLFSFPAGSRDCALGGRSRLGNRVGCSQIFARGAPCAI